MPKRLALLAVLLLACHKSSPPDAGVPVPDAGAPDAGPVRDGGLPPDAGLPDGGVPDAGAPDGGVPGHAIKTVFLILMENRDWSDIVGNPSAPYLNSLLSQGAYATQYFNPPGLHPSLPNYLWLEAGQNFGVFDDGDPAANHQSSTAHLVNLLEDAGVSWKAYQEDIDGKSCPLTSVNRYAPKHDPFVYFDDVTDTNNPQAARCLAHVRPYGELAQDLQRGTVPAYNFITPNLCNDMHDSSGCATNDQIKNGDTWLSHELPPILGSSAFQKGGVVLITWDEGGDDGPIGMIVLSPFAKVGFASSVHHTHSATLRTIEEIFGVTPYLGFAANSEDLSEMFQTFP